MGFFACSGESNSENTPPVDTLAKYKTQGQYLKRTIIAYITGDNNLSSNLGSDIQEMVTGSKTLDDSCRLIVFADIASTKPYIAEIRNGKITKSKSFDTDFMSVSPDSMLSVMQWIVNNYPANEYGAIIEGHGSGSIINKDTLSTKIFSLNAYGYDNVVPTGYNTQWMNIPSMAKVFSKLPHMSFLFFDCCCMGNIETAYELRKSTDYIIAPVCETPASGAAYDKIVPILSNKPYDLSKFIIDKYVEGLTNKSVGGICMTAINTSKLESLRDATKTILQNIYSNSNQQELDFSTLLTRKPIYYYRDYYTNGNNVLQDMKCSFKLAVEEGYTDQAHFDSWLTVFNDAVIYKSTPDTTKTSLWLTNTDGYPDINFYVFNSYFNDEHYGALSMIFPDKYYDYAEPSYPSLNKTMFKLTWCNVVGWHDFGW